MTAKRLVRKNLAYKALTEVIARALSFIFYVMLARYMGEADFGLFSILYSVGAMVVFMVDPGLNLALIRGASRNRSIIIERAGDLLALKLILSFCAVVVCGLYGAMTGAAAGVILLFGVMGANMAAFALSEFAAAIYQAQERMEMETWLMSIGKTGVTLVAIIAVATGYGLAITLAMMTMAQIVAALWALRRAARDSEVLLLGAKVEMTRWLPLLREALPLGLMSFFVIAFYRIDVALAPLFGFTVEQTGWYAAGVKVVDVALAAPTLIMAALFPTLSRLAEEDRAGFVRLARKGLWLIGLCGLFMGSFIFFYPTPVMELLFGIRFVPGAEPLQWLGVAVMLIYFRHALLNLLIVDHRARPALMAVGAALPVNVAFNIVLTPMYGITGMAFAKLGTELFVLMLLMLAWRRSPVENS